MGEGAAGIGTESKNLPRLVFPTREFSLNF